jgi:4-alpha-glucanotransferase
MDRALTSDAKLHQLALAAGLEPDWVDAAGVARHVSPEILRTVLKRLGLAAEGDAAIDESLSALRDENRRTPPLLAVWAGDVIPLSHGEKARILDEQGAEIASNHADAASPLRAPAAPGYYRIEIGTSEHQLAVAPERCVEIGGPSGRKLAGLAVQLYALRGGHTAHFGDLAALRMRF